MQSRETGRPQFLLELPHRPSAGAGCFACGPSESVYLVDNARCESLGRLASEQPDNFKTAARPGLSPPEWPDVLGGLGNSGLAPRVAGGRWRAGGQVQAGLSGKLLPCAAGEYS